MLDLSERIETGALTSLYEVGAAMEHCYFPERGVVALIVRLADGFESASGMVGPEGLIGLGALADDNLPAPNAFVVQIPFSGWRIRSTLMRAAMLRSPVVLDRVLRFDQAIKSQIAQTVVCNRRHNVQQRLARWLLMASDRTVGDELPLTHEFLSAAIGAQRASVTLAAKLLRDAGAIQYHHGRVRIRDRRRLKAISCECYGVVRAHYQRLLNWPSL
ncbi:MAG TPA: Crp/Fnr family transcriptional regulator [Stellaceae bacterium]|nr:Crp/Fnr family transcriptional regulator [Stellaceae bacterium]